LDATVNIHNPLTASLYFGTTYSCNDCSIDSSSYPINSFWPRAPTWGSAAPERVETCRPPSHGLKQSQAFQDGIIS